MNQTCNNISTPYNKTCEEQPTDCTFRFAEYHEGETFDHGYENAHYIIYCSRGVTRLKSNLFKEEIICGGEILFLPRMADCRGEVMQDSHAIIHIFNNTVCTPENCILSYLYRHNHKSAGSAEYRCKLKSYKVFDTFMASITHYLQDNTSTPQLWHMKHRELIHLFCNYYQPDELRSFFRPLVGEGISFKRLVMSHYRKATQTEELAELCGYGLHNFRRVFKNEFDIAPYKWLMMKRAEHIRHKLSSSSVSFTDIIEEFNFSSAGHFSNFCKQFLGDTPSNLRNNLSENPEAE